VDLIFMPRAWKSYDFHLILPDKIQENSVQIQTLAQVRDSLLPKLMSGKIKI
jgi:hypothetical protein